MTTILNDPFELGLGSLDEIIAKNFKKLYEEQLRGRPMRRGEKSEQVTIRNANYASIDEVKMQTSNYNKLDLKYLHELDLQCEPCWPTNEEYQCDNCKRTIEQFGGVVLRNCQSHNLCKFCLFEQLWLPIEMQICPVKDCGAAITHNEYTKLIEERVQNLAEQERMNELPAQYLHHPERSPKQHSLSVSNFDKYNIHEGGRSGIEVQNNERKEFQLQKSTAKHSTMSFSNTTLSKCFSDRIPQTSVDQSGLKLLSETNKFTASSNNKEVELNLNYINEQGKLYNDYWPTNLPCQCHSCGSWIAAMKGVVFKACRKHNVCMACVGDAISADALCLTCPVKHCDARITCEELEYILQTELIEQAQMSEVKIDDLDFSEFNKLNMRNEVVWPISAFNKCDSCGQFVKELQGVVLRNCQKHRLCKACVFGKIYSPDKKCPVDKCGAVIEENELEHLRKMKRDFGQITNQRQRIIHKYGCNTESHWHSVYQPCQRIIIGKPLICQDSGDNPKCNQSNRNHASLKGEDEISKL